VSFFIPLNKKVNFFNYHIENFSQKVDLNKEKKIAHIRINYFYRKFPEVSKGFLVLRTGENSNLNKIVYNLFNSSESYTDYVKNTLLFLKENIKYNEKRVPQDASSVLIRGSAYCTGFTNLAYYLLSRAGVKVKKVSGFYFYKKRNILQKHNWIEVFFPSYGWFAVDPVSRKFSNFYIYGKIEKSFISIKNFSIDFKIQN